MTVQTKACLFIPTAVGKNWHPFNWISPVQLIIYGRKYKETTLPSFCSLSSRQLHRSSAGSFSFATAFSENSCISLLCPELLLQINKLHILGLLSTLKSGVLHSPPLSSLFLAPCPRITFSDTSLLNEKIFVQEEKKTPVDPTFLRTPQVPVSTFAQSFSYGITADQKSQMRQTSLKKNLLCLSQLDVKWLPLQRKQSFCFLLYYA